MELLKEIAEILCFDVNEAANEGELKVQVLKEVRRLKDEANLHETPLNIWQLLKKEDFPPPTTGTDVRDTKCPIFQHLLASWSSDLEKQAYVEDWVNSLRKDEADLPTDFPYGLQIVAVDSVLRDAFLSILIPIIEELNSRPEPKYVVYVRRRYRPVNLDEETTTSKDFSFDIRIKIPRPETSVATERSTSVSEWWEAAPNLLSLGENIIQSPLAQNLVSILPPSLTGVETSTTNEGPDESETAEEKALREEEQRKRREDDRRWSSQISTGGNDRQRAKSSDSGTGGVGPDDQAPHKALRGSEVAIFAEFDAPLTREAQAISGLSDPAVVHGAVAAASSAEHKKSIIEAKLAKLREGRKGAIA